SLSPEGVKALWADIKAAERREKEAARARAGRPTDADGGALSGVPLPLPALTRALKLQQKAGKVGFDWNDAPAGLAQLREETEEIDEALARGEAGAIKDEIGDLLFVVVNLARHAEVDPEQALRGCNAKFARRFAHIESTLAARGRAPSEASLTEMDALWN